MKKTVIVFIFLVSCSWLYGQQTLGSRVTSNPNVDNGLFANDSTSFSKSVKIEFDGEKSYKDYRVFTIFNDTAIIDTTLTMQKDYKFNFIRKDDFELLPFHNLGQTFNNLGYSFENQGVIPKLGASAKLFNYLRSDEMLYYKVPTPTTELMYRTGLEQGQVLDALLTMNTSPEFNFSFAYKGLRSLGKYRNALASHGNFRTTFTYQSKSHKYEAKGHFYSYDFLNNENGGLTEESLLFFEANDPNYEDRARLDVNFTDAENLYEGKRYFLHHALTLISNYKPEKETKEKSAETEKGNQKPPIPAKGTKQKGAMGEVAKRNLKGAMAGDSTNLQLPPTKIDSVTQQKLASKIDSASVVTPMDTVGVRKDSIAIQKDTIPKPKDSVAIDSSTAKPYAVKLGHRLLYETSHYRFKQDAANELFGEAFETTISDHTSYQQFQNELFLEVNSPYTGILRGRVGYLTYKYHYNSILFYDAATISNRIDGDAITVGADWKTRYGNVFISATGQTIISGDITGSSIDGEAMYKKDSLFTVKGIASFVSKTPNFNKLLYQSDYLYYNWQNNFDNEQYATLGGEISLPKWGSVKATFHVIDGYTYFDENSLPVQASETLSYVKVKAHAKVSYRKFSLENTVMYQRVTDGDSFFRVPEIVTRNSLYFSSYLFKGKPMYLQTGVTFKYFTSFMANAYNPVLAEFRLQNDAEIGNFPMLDFFANAQIQRTRLFFKIENITAKYTGRTYYSAPTYPYRDFTVRFGIVWNFFI